ncbi:MAG: GNAT family N-acetyltransferase [Lachnospiraceae bacterium]|nr:GNAT family N-acetyltransferase [Lachnospiraceae bacterium]
MNITDYSIKRIYSITDDILLSCTNIVSLCNDKTNYPHSFFFDEEAFVSSPSNENIPEDELPVMYIASNKDGVIGFISTYYLDDYIEVCSFVHPSLFGQGIFSATYNLFMEDYAGYDIIASCFPEDTELKSFLEHLGFKLKKSELLMKLEKEKKNSFSTDIEIKKNIYESEICYTIYSNETIPIGEGYAFLDECSSTIHDIFVKEDFRGNGFGFKLVNYMIEDLFATKNSILLHVTKENAAAYSLYKKLGFETVEQLDYFLSTL